MDYVQLLMIGWAIWAKNVNQNAKNEKRPPKSWKNKMFIFGLCSNSDDRPSDPSNKMSTKMQKNKKGPLNHRKIEMLGFGLCSTSDDRSKQSEQQNVDQNTKKSEIEIGLNMNTIGKKSFHRDVINAHFTNLPPTSYDWLIQCLKQTGEAQLKWVYGLKPHPTSPLQNKMKCSFLDYIQLLMIGWAIQCDSKVDPTPLQPKKWNACFRIDVPTSDWFS